MKSVETSGRHGTDKAARRKAEDKIKASLDEFIQRMMNAKLMEEGKKTTDTQAGPQSFPKLDTNLDYKELKEICFRSREVCFGNLLYPL